MIPLLSGTEREDTNERVHGTETDSQPWKPDGSQRSQVHSRRDWGFGTGFCTLSAWNDRPTGTCGRAQGTLAHS